MQIDVEVALEEDPGYDSERGITVDGQPVPVDVHRHDAELTRAGKRLDGNDLTHIDAGDANRRGNVQLRFGCQHRLENEWRPSPGHAAPKYQVAHDRDHNGADHTGSEARDPISPSPHLPAAFVSSVCTPTLPGGLPITAAAPEYRSFPAEHSAVWPGDAVFG